MGSAVRTKTALPKLQAWAAKYTRRIADVLAVVLILLSGAYLIVVFFKVEVCDEVLAQTGDVRTLCRHPALTDAFMAPAAVIMIAALSTFFAELSGFGVTIKRRLDKVENAAARALHDARDALLAIRYNAVRAEFVAGPQRDKEMAPVWQEMMDVLRDVEKYDVVGALGDAENDGRRLLGYAYLATHPGEATWRKLLFETIRSDKNHFNQEMGLRALGLILRADPRLLDEAMRVGLDNLKEAIIADKVRKGRGSESNRANQIRHILGQ